MKKNGWFFAACLLAFFVGFQMVRWGRETRAATGSPLNLEPVEGMEVEVVLVVSPSCSGCNNPGLPAAWSTITSSFQETASRQGTRATLTGVSIGADPQEGIDFLSGFGPFHELLTGRGWLGQGARFFVKETHKGPAVVPQVVVIERLNSVGSDGILEMAEERVSQRRHGAEGLLGWAEEIRARSGSGGNPPEI